MEIDKIIETLNEQGYQSHKDNNLIVVRTDDIQLTPQILREKLEQLDYHNSFELILIGDAADKYRTDFEKKSIFGKRERVTMKEEVTMDEADTDVDLEAEDVENESDFNFSENPSGQLSFF